VDITKEKNYGRNEDIIVQFVANAYVGIVEWWLKNGMPYPPRIMAEQVGILLERNLYKKNSRAYAARPFSTQKTNGRFVALRSDRQNIRVPRRGRQLPVFSSLRATRSTRKKQRSAHASRVFPCLRMEGKYMSL